MYNNSLFVSKPTKPYNKINDIVKKTMLAINGNFTPKLMLQNPYEKLVPFNFWFKNSKYSIKNIYQNQQNLRARFYDSKLLTPLVSNYEEANHLKNIINDMSLYQPFYPETFFTIWEFLQLKHLPDTYNKFLHIGTEHSFGSMEAIIMYHERYQAKYQYNVYDCILVGNEKYNLVKGYYELNTVPIDYLGQAYKVNHLVNTKEMITYDFISIDVNQLLDSLFLWSNEEMDLQANLFYLLLAVKHLEKKGSLIMKLNMLGSKSWSIFCDIVKDMFTEHTFVRPVTSNPFNSEIYLYASFPKPTDKYAFYETLYPSKVYQTFYLNYSENHKNKLFKKYDQEIDNWIEIVKNTLQMISKGDVPKNALTEWHGSNDLLQMSSMKDNKNFVNEYVRLKIATEHKKYKFLPDVPNELYNKRFYKKLIEKRAVLNYHKRVMDTKPSSIFMASGTYDKNPQYLTWEQLIQKIDCNRDLKKVLSKDFGTEMTTNAFVKMYEMLNNGVLDISGKELKSFHLCEAPGAFVSAMNQYMTTIKPDVKWEWYAQTLKPTCTGTITDEALQDHYGLIRSYPEKWLFGDGSGDITRSAVIKSYMKELKGIKFMTADAGLHCHPTDLNEQEAFLCKINMGQVVCILACLEIGGSAIFKTFLPMSEPLTISLIFLVTNLFSEVHIIKPTSSHSNNSEVYVELKKYKGIPKEDLQMLFVLLDDEKITSKSVLFETIDVPFFKTFTTAANLLIDKQINSLRHHYYYYYNSHELKHYSTINDWLSKNKVIIMPRDKLLIK